MDMINCRCTTRREENRFLVKNYSPKLKDLCKQCGLDHNFRPTLEDSTNDDETPSLRTIVQQRRLLEQEAQEVKA